MTTGDERWSTHGFETRAIHAGQDPDPATGAVVVPVYLTSTYAQRAVGEHQGYEYSRSGNPTRTALERCVASLEGGRHAFAFASGLAAEDAVLRQLEPGAGIVLGDDAYGGTYRLAKQVYEPAGYRLATADLTSMAALDAAWSDDTRLVWLESPTNPLLTVVDIAAVAGVAHDRGALVVVDNTFATPYLQNPLALGADVVIHSSTKYLGGHSDVVGGVAVLDDDDFAARISFTQNAVGAVPGPLDCYLVLRGIKTLGVRMDRHNENAAAVADALVAHPAVEQVLFPGLAGHPGHDLAQRQMRGFGGMVSFTVRGGEAAALDLVRRTKVFTLAESLGAVESLIEHPGRMTHASVAGSPVEVPGALVRLSVGLESAADLVADLVQALDAIGSGGVDT